MPSTYIPLLVLGMLSTGTINTLLNKYQDLTCIRNCDTRPEYFEQPLIQTLNMFLGEVICLVVWGWMNRNQGYTALPEEPEEEEVVPTEEQGVPQEQVQEELQAQPLQGLAQLYFLIPTVCDLTATTLMNVGLLYVSASIYQMLRGSVVICTFFLSYFIQGPRPWYKFMAVVIVFLGVGIVGMASTHSDTSSGNPVVGTLLVVLAQFFTATQFVVEERLLQRYSVEPLKAVGLEGLFGCILLFILIPLLHLCIGQYHPGSLFDVQER
jgi:drug/metabolite transporter (DMT)-like permease